MKSLAILAVAFALAACAPTAHYHKPPADTKPTPVAHHHHGWLGDIVHRLHDWAHSN